MPSIKPLMIEGKNNVHECSRKFLGMSIGVSLSHQSDESALTLEFTVSGPGRDSAGLKMSSTILFLHPDFVNKDFHPYNRFTLYTEY